MASAARSGRARISLRHPTAMAECDRCSFWYSLNALQKQFQWAGNSLADTGLLVCSDCLDVPQDQFRTPIFPSDPVPRVNPRPSSNVTPFPIIGQPLPTSPGNLGFSQYVLGAAGTPGLYPSTQAGALAAALSQAGVTAPAGLYGFVANLARETSTWLLGPDAARTFLMIYNPSAAQVQINLSAGATMGTLGNLAIGPGETYFWSTTQGLGTVWQGSLAAVSPVGSALPLWYWTDGAGFVSDGGILMFSGAAAAYGYPTSSAGLPAGAVYCPDGLTINVVPGGAAGGVPALYFGQTSAPYLLGLGGGFLPASGPAPGSSQLWNNGGQICIA